MSGVLFSMVVRWQVSVMCQECCFLYGSEVAGARGIVYYGSETLRRAKEEDSANLERNETDNGTVDVCVM